MYEQVQRELRCRVMAKVLTRGSRCVSALGISTRVEESDVKIVRDDKTKNDK